MGGRENYEQEKGMGKEQVLGAMEKIYSRRRYMEKQKKSEEHNEVGQRI